MKPCHASPFALLSALLLIGAPAHAQQVIRTLGSPGRGPGLLLGVNGLAVGANGRVYVTDVAGAEIEVFDNGGTPLLRFGAPGACGLAVDDSLQRLLVSDGVGDRIQVFSLAGNFLGEWGSTGSGIGQFRRPCQIGVNPSNGLVYVEDGLNDRIQVFSSLGSFLRKFGSSGGGPGEFQNPSHLAYSSFLGLLFVADTSNARVQVFDPQGNFVLSFPSNSADNPFGLATDGAGRIYLERDRDVQVVALFDRDGDGLLDTWEIAGLDVDGDGTIDVDLPAFGADPDHKDLFLEMDWMPGALPSRAAIQRVKEAFAQAPADAGGVSNPDGGTGIRLWVDTGSLADPQAREDGAAIGSCGDGMDNGADGLADGADSDCRVGDDLGGGNAIAFTNLSGLSATFYAAKGSNFGGPRSMAFRYSISSASPTNAAGTSTGGNTASTLVDSGKSWVPNEWSRRQLRITGGTGSGQSATIASNSASTLTLSPATEWTTVPDDTSTYAISLVGGQGELGGNDFVEFNHDAGSIMHEFGHNLNLQHGGFQEANCKPNYVSVMNYSLAFGIPQVGGGSLIDYSPPRFPGGRGRAPIDDLVENMLDEGAILDSSDPANRFVYSTPTGKVVSPLNGDVDGDGAGDANGNGLGDGVDWDQDRAVPDNSSATVNIDTNGPGDCSNGSSSERLVGFDDWTHISLGWLGFGDTADGPLNPVTVHEPTRDELIDLQRELNSTDLAVTQTADPVEVGDPLIYRVRVRNLGPNPAAAAALQDELPTRAAFQSATPACWRSGTHTLDCDFGEILPGLEREVQIEVDTSSACENGRPQALRNVAVVRNAPEFPGPDRDPSNDRSELEVTPLDTTPPTITCNAPATIVPPDAPISFEAGAFDRCDSDPRVEALSFSCSKTTKKGKIVDKRESCGVRLSGPSVTIIDSGGVDDRITWRVRATDVAGNALERLCEVQVVNPGKGPK